MFLEVDVCTVGAAGEQVYVHLPEVALIKMAQMQKMSIESTLQNKRKSDDKKEEMSNISKFCSEIFRII